MIMCVLGNCVLGMWWFVMIMLMFSVLVVVMFVMLVMLLLMVISMLGFLCVVSVMILGDRL